MSLLQHLFFEKYLKGRSLSLVALMGRAQKQYFKRAMLMPLLSEDFFTSNPDLPERLKNSWPLTPYNRDAFWGGNEQCYIDFPAYNPSIMVK